MGLPETQRQTYQCLFNEIFGSVRLLGVVEVRPTSGILKWVEREVARGPQGRLILQFRLP